MTDGGLIFAFVISLAMLFSAGVIIFRYRKKTGFLEERLRDNENSLEGFVRERTRELEATRDSISEFAVDRYELARELEQKNLEIVRQKDDLEKQSERLKNAYEEIQGLVNFRNQMTRMLIHDLKNPLNIMLNITEGGTLSTSSAITVRKLAWEMHNLIMNLLEVEKFGSSKMKADKTSFDLYSLMVHINDKYSIVLNNADINLRIELPQHTRVIADQNLTERILDNLVGNAVKYNKTGGLILISGFIENNFVRVEVKDDGEGIASDIIDDIFSEYTHGKKRSLAYTNATGIGLAFCRLASEAQGGKTGIYSTPGKGTTVWFTLPANMEINNAFDGNAPGFDLIHRKEISLEERDFHLAGKFAAELKLLEVFQVSSINRVLGNPVFEMTENLRKWKGAFEKSVYAADNERYRYLLSFFPGE